MRSEINRFLNKVKQLQTPCWIWTGATTHGYGAFGTKDRDGKKRSVRAHRYIYEYWCGQIPKGMEVDHLCHQRRCVNPAHLELVTHQINCHRSLRPKYVDEQEVIRMRKRGASYKEIQKKLDISETTVWRIIKKRLHA